MSAQTIRFRGAVADMFRSTDSRICVHGPAGTGKTTAVLWKLRCLAEKYPGFRGLMARAQRVDMTDSVLVTMDEHVLGEGHPALLSQDVTRAGRRFYRFPNGSEIIVAGLNNPGKTYSAEYDVIALFETHEISHDSYIRLARCLRAKGLPWKQVVIDTMPESPAHWIKRGMDDGSIRNFRATHKDNPRWWDGKQWTPDGIAYLAQLEQMTGVAREQMLHGRWVASADSIFDLDVLDEHRKRYARDPLHVGRLELLAEGRELDRRLAAGDRSVFRWVPDPDGPWRVWLPLDASGRPSPHNTYALACDPSWGQGAANGVIAVGSREHRAKVAEFADAETPPEAMARQMVAAGLWFGGRRGHGYLIWERNGPGGGLTRIIPETLAYPWFYTQRSLTGTDTNVPGWWSDPQSKLDAVTLLKDQYAAQAWINPSERAIEEAMAWIMYDNGQVGPTHLVRESAKARSTHGDRVIADMLLVMAMGMIPPEPVGKVIYPPGSLGYTLEREREEEEASMTVRE